MLTRLNENIKLVNNLSKPHKGLVVLTDAAETKKLGRVKVRIRGLIEETDTTKLPWVYPQSPAGLGGKPNCSGFMVPELGSEVTVVFPFDDIYAPFYIGHWKSDLTIQDELFAGADYPEVYGFVDSQIQWIKVNKKSGTNEVEIYNQQGGLLIKLDSSGKLLIHAKNGLEISVPTGTLDIKADSINLESKTGDINLKSAAKINSDAVGDVNIKSGSGVNTQTSAGDIDVKSAAKVNIEATTDANIKGTANVNVQATGLLNAKSTGALILEGTAAASIKTTGILALEGTTSSSIKSTGITSIDGLLINENMSTSAIAPPVVIFPPSAGTADSADSATVTDTDTAKTDADTLAGTIGIPTGIGGFD